jgi:hypothetical protein
VAHFKAVLGNIEVKHKNPTQALLVQRSTILQSVSWLSQFLSQMLVQNLKLDFKNLFHTQFSNHIDNPSHTIVFI